jgi:hypothetical protein
MIAWNPDEEWIAESTRLKAGPKAVEVGPWPDYTGWSNPYLCTAGCCAVAYWPKLRTREQKMEELIRGFFYLVLSEGLEPDAVHREFSKIRGYLEYEGSIGLGFGPAVFFQDGKMNPYSP